VTKNELTLAFHIASKCKCAAAMSLTLSRTVLFPKVKFRAGWLMWHSFRLVFGTCGGRISAELTWLIYVAFLSL